MQHFLFLTGLIFTLSAPAFAQNTGFEPIAPIVPSVPEGGPPPAPDGESETSEKPQSPPAQAGSTGSAVPAPAAPQGDQRCGQIDNQSGYKIYGTIATDIAGERQGVAARHRATLRLEPGEKRDICSQGPFYEGQRLELTLRSLFPIFSCKTAIAGRVITIRSEPREDGDGLRFFAQCY